MATSRLRKILWTTAFELRVLVLEIYTCLGLICNAAEQFRQSAKTVLAHRALVLWWR